MKKGDASKARRRTTANFSLLRKFDHGDESTKDGLQVVTEKVVLDSNSAWYGAEIIYIVRTVRKTKKGARNNTQISAVAQPSESLRYLILLRRRDAQQNVILLRVNLKDDEVETKNHFELRALRSIDFGSEVDNELLLSFDSADQNIFFVTQTDRDEALWIVIQVCKNVLTIELTIGYSIDIDALSFITNTNGTLSRFPVLQKMVQAHTKDLGDFFSNEETEAENLLDELQWGKSQGQTGLKQVLAVQSAQISDEIIDFLVQWEEMDEHAVQAGPIEGMSDTSEVLTALSHVDEELHAVDEWLGEQIERLEEIQSNLHMIEDESGALESSWNSLQSVQEVVTSLVNRYSLSAEHEQLLKSQGQLQAVLRAPTLDRVGRSLAPLVGAMQTVRDAIKLRFEDVADVSSAQWKQLQNLSSIATQKGKLHDAVDSCCDALSDTALGLFEWLLKHRVMSEGGLAMKQFPLGPVLKWQGAAADPEGLAALPDWLGAVCGEGNALIRVKGLYEKNLTHFLPLLDLFAELSPAALAPLQDKYVRSVAEGLYRPLFRVLRRDLALVTAKQTVVTLANCAAYRIKSGPHLLLTFANGSIKGHVSAGAAHSLTPWGALKLALLVVVPALEREEAFMKTIFHLGGTARMTDAAVLAKQRTSMRTIFDPALHKLALVLGLRAEEEAAVDGVAAIAMLATLAKFERAHRQALVFRGAEGIRAEVGAAREAREEALVDRPSPNRRKSDAGGVGGAGVGAWVDKEAEEADVLAEAEAQYHALYLTPAMQDMRSALVSRVGLYAGEVAGWIRAQRADSRLPEVLQPFAAFPTLVAQLLEVCDSESFPCVEDLLRRVAMELFQWLTTASHQTEKHADKIKITNYGFFAKTISPMGVPIMENFVANAAQQHTDSVLRYVNWMVAYEFPALSELAVRLDGLGKRVNEEELSLYIRRKDVLNVVRELELKGLEGKVKLLRKRLEKHFRSDFDVELQQVEKIWRQLQDRVGGILSRLEEAASVSYQIHLEVGPQTLRDLFSKFVGHKTVLSDE